MTLDTGEWRNRKLAGKAKRKLDYAGWSTDIFDNDTKIDKLLDAQGWIGFGIYFFLCQKAFGSDGYFYKWGFDDCASTARKMGGGVGSGTVKETVDYCLHIGLFNKRLFDEWGVLTSKGIQRSYWAVAKSRRDKAVAKELWILEESECEGVIFVPLNTDLSETNSNSSATNYDMSATNDTVVKGSVVNSIYIAHSDESRDTESLDQFYESIWKLYPVKKGKGQVSKTKKQVLQRIGYEHIKRCIDRFVADMEDSHRDKKYWMHGSTFFNGGYVDYLDENFTNDVKKNIAVPEEQQDEEEIVGDDWWKY